MGTFSFWHGLILLDVVLVPLFLILLIVVKPAGANRFGLPPAPVRLFEAVTTCFRKFADFNGRARRSEFWWFCIGANLIAGLLARFLGPVGQLAALVLWLPLLAVGARRLHDINRSGWWLLMSLTGVGGFILLVLFALPSPKNELSMQAEVFE